MKKIISVFIALYSLNALAYYTQDIPNQCGVIQNKGLFAVFKKNEYTCQSGYFLPAYTAGCQPCPSECICNGGTYEFDENYYQGVAIRLDQYITHNLANMCALNAYHKYSAIFTPNIHTCSPGEYLPANNDGCVACPVNSYCPGGTYTFNETTAQGINPCPAGTVAPSGMWELEQCGHTLHIGTNTLYLRTTKKTTPALNFDFDGDGVADLFANTTTSDRIMNRDSLQKLKIKVGDTVYSVYDDTMEQ